MMIEKQFLLDLRLRQVKQLPPQLRGLGQDDEESQAGPINHAKTAKITESTPQIDWVKIRLKECLSGQLLLIGNCSKIQPDEIGAFSKHVGIKLWCWLLRRCLRRLLFQW